LPSDPFAALADPTRRSILDVLRERETLTAGEIASRFPLVSRAAVSKHLGVLRRAHLVRARHRGRENHYRLERDRIAEVQEWLERFAPAMEESLRRLKKQVEEGSPD
jgi:DNA-binding transcriptional ArsR family regulator